MVRRDRDDILVDVTMHMANGRLWLRSQPARCRSRTWPYCGTTGLATMDYRLSDPYLDRPGLDESIYSERRSGCRELLVLRAGDRGAAGGFAAGRESGGITFGCLNNFSKVDRAGLAALGPAAARVPGSRLLLHARPAATAIACCERCAARRWRPRG